MLISGLPSPAPAMLAALMSGTRPSPFDAAADGFDLWERRFGLFPEVAAFIGAERLPQPEVWSEALPGTQGGLGAELEGVTGPARLLVAASSITEKWIGARKAVLTVAGEKDALVWPVVMANASLVVDLVKSAFSLLSRESLPVLRLQLDPLLTGPLCRWAWVVGLLEGAGRPLLPWRVLDAICEEGKEDPIELMEALIVVRLLQGQSSMAGYVLSRWLTEMVWGPRGLSGVLPDFRSPLMGELQPIWDQRDRVLSAPAFMDAKQQEEMEALGWEAKAPNGIAMGAALLLKRLELYCEGDAGSEVRHAFSCPWVEEDPDLGEEVTTGEARVAWANRMRAVGLQEDKFRRVLLTEVDAELATQAALLVFRWRAYWMGRRVWSDPQGFVSAVESWISGVLFRWGEPGPSLRYAFRGAVGDYLLQGFGESTAEGVEGVLEEVQQLDWRVTEILRPLIYAAMSSLAIAVKAGHADDLAKVEWIREKVWDPSGPPIRVEAAVEGLFRLARSEQTTVKRIDGRERRWAKQIGVKVQELKDWLEAQPFDLDDLEAFRIAVESGEAQLLSIGGLRETLNARAHFKPAWIVGPLTGLSEPRPHGNL